MSMMDETPDYFIRDGNIYAHHAGSTYVSGGFRDHEPSYNQLLEKATPANINKFLKGHNQPLYNYDTGRTQTQVESDYKDAFGNNIFEGDNILMMDCYYDGSFRGYIKGEVTGFTKEFVKIKPIKHDRLNSWFDNNKLEFLRKPYRIIAEH
jgi:hypothetical protein